MARSPETNSDAVVKVTSTEMGDENHIFKIEMLKEKDQKMNGGISYRNPVIEIKDFQKLRRSVMIKERELWVAYLLWFFLGPVGVHKFFLGKTGMGILYLFTGGIFLIGWIIDLFTLPSQVRAYNDEVRSLKGEIPL